MSGVRAEGPREAARDAGLALLGVMRRHARQVFDSLTEEQWLAQAGEGTNHAMWVAGHLATSYGYFSAMLGGTNPAPESYHLLFDAKTEPLCDAGAYPPAAEVLAVMDECLDAYVEAVGSLKEEELGEMFDPSFEGMTKGDTVLLALYHDGFHAGQVASARKARGLAPMFV